MVLPINGSLSSLQWWTQSNLPAIYDDSLSYYELLSKVLSQLNTNSDFTNGLKDSFNALFTDEWIDTKNLKDGIVTTKKLDPNIVKQPTDTVGIQAKFADLDTEIADIDASLAHIALFADKYVTLHDAVMDAVNKGKRLYLPNGTYTIDTLITVTSDINSSEANKPIYIEGESPNGVILTSTLDTIIDFSKSKHVFLKNLMSDKFIKIMNYGADETLNSSREVVAQNVFNTSTTGEPINWYNLVCLPSPSAYEDNSGGLYSRYGLEIQTYSGYNALMITNHSKSVENSPIGITDTGTDPTGNGLSTPSILLDRTGAKRPIMQVRDRNNVNRSPNRDSVFEVDDNGHVAIGTDTTNDDGSGIAGLKIKDINPNIILFDPSTSKTFQILLSGSNVNISGGIVISVANNEVWGFPDFKIPINITTPGEGVIMKTPDGGAQYKISIDNNGNVITTRE